MDTTARFHPLNIIRRANEIGIITLFSIIIFSVFLQVVARYVFNRPLVVTSANPSGMNPATTAQEVAVYFPGQIGLTLDAVFSSQPFKPLSNDALKE